MGDLFKAYFFFAVFFAFFFAAFGTVLTSKRPIDHILYLKLTNAK